MKRSAGTGRLKRLLTKETRVFFSFHSVLGIWLMSPKITTLVPRTQLAALPWRRTGEQLEVLMITSRLSRHWLIPKGWPMKGKTDAEAAAREAYEEAGIIRRRTLICVESPPIRTRPLSFAGFPRSIAPVALGLALCLVDNQALSLRLLCQGSRR